MPSLTRHRPLRLISELNITPLLAVVVVLLLVLLVAIPFQGIHAAGASASSAAPHSVAKLTVDKRQSLWLDGTSIESQDLKAALVTLRESEPGVGVVVQIDPSVPVDGLVRIMDTLRQAGVQKTAVKTLDK